MGAEIAPAHLLQRLRLNIWKHSKAIAGIFPLPCGAQYSAIIARERSANRGFPTFHLAGGVPHFNDPYPVAPHFARSANIASAMT